MLDKFSSADFSPHLNQKFNIHVEGSDPVEAELTEVSDLKSDTVDSSKRQPFSLVFVCQHNDPLEQMIYKLEHEKMGEITLFLVPVAQDDKGVHYEAVFN